MAAIGRAGGTQDEDAKEVLDKIGQQVHDQVKNEAERRSNSDLKGFLTGTTIFGGKIDGTLDPCQLQSEYTKLIKAKSNRYPCGNESVSQKRFSVKQQAEYDNKKMKCSNGGACAPYRRLHLCHHNLETINNTTSTAKHDLLGEVCMAAYHEGDSIKTHYPLHQQIYGDSPSEMCTMLARSFADIGDIIRGRDLYSGNKKEKKQREDLEKNLKRIFQEIYDKLLEDNKTRGSNGKKEEIERRYGSDKDFFQLREDWWTLNREKVWKAITCHAGQSDKYFRHTCGTGKDRTATNNNCRCNGDQVPTYFDYVPQYLRWFEEWAEDFCRKKKKKVENLQKQCRGKYQSADRYCSRNGFDCEQTISRIGKVRMGKGCTDCFFACYPYVDWIDKKKEEFDKQKNKYTDEMKKYTNGGGGSGRTRQTRRARSISTDDNGYEKIFYKKLQETEYKDVGKFLEKLNNEKACKEVDDPQGGTIHFEKVNSSSASDSGTNDENKGTFYRSKYCQPCPDCGVKYNGSGWEEKDKSGQCKNIKLYEPIDGKNGTTINFLYSGDRHVDIAKKLKEFCAQTQNGTGSGTGGGGGGGGTNIDSSLCEPWKCYQPEELTKVGEGEDDEDDVASGGGLCILPNPKKNQDSGKNSSNEPEQFQKTFHDFFFYWVAHMLKDSIHWRTKKIKKCLENGKQTKCRNGCKGDCDCFQRWIDKKKSEWKPIKEHFYNQKNLNGRADFINWSRYYILEWNLEQEFLKKDSTEDSEEDSQSRDEDAKETKRIKEMFDKKKQERELGASNEETILDFLLKEELNDATKCQKDCEETQPKPDRGGARSADPQVPTAPTAGGGAHDDDLDEDDDNVDDDDVEEEENDGEQDTADETKQGEEGTTPGPQETTTTEKSVDVCAIVAKALTIDTLQKACPTKYGSKAPTSWKCIPSDTKSVATSENGDAKSRVARSAPSGTNQSSICVPPRRRKLYVGKLEQWAEKQVGDKGESQTPLASTQAGTPSRAQDPLLAAFVESAAIETFFLWDRYKKEKEKEKKEKNRADGQIYESVGEDEANKNKDPQQLLQEKGEIPEEFKRQMFYTFGDYRDICVGVKDNDVIEALEASGDENIETIKKAIDKILNSGNKEHSGENPRKKWWEANGQHIWNGMICALTYNTDTPSGTAPTQNEQVKKELLESDGKKPKSGGKYEYKNVTISSGPSGYTTLSKFSEKPQFIRWLEEWGEEFCRKQKHKLYIIKKDCRGRDGDEKCSGDGFECKTESPKKEDIFKYFNCPSCANSCRWYKKWIKKKRTEYDKQSNAYEQQKTKCQSKSDNGFCGTLQKFTTAGDFLERLKNGPCKNNNDDDNDNGEDEIDFKEKVGETFKYEKYCGTCSEFKVNCNNGVCTGGHTKGNCNGGTITAKDIIDDENSNGNMEMLVSDNNPNGNKYYDLKECTNANIFKSIKKDKYKCRNVCGVDICTLEKTNNNNGQEKYEHITVKEFLKRWLESFLEDYNKINKKLKPCMNKGEQSTCINDYDEKHKCVDEWIKLKKKEWETIRKRYFEQYKGAESDMKSLVKNFLEDLQSQIAVTINKAIKPCDGLEKFQNSTDCTVAGSSESGKHGTPKDIVECLLDKLKKKTESCPDQTSGYTQGKCQNPTTLPDDEDLLLEEEENTVGKQQPSFCPQTSVEEKKKEEEEDTCTPATTTPKETAPTTPKNTEADSGKGTEEPPPRPGPPAPAPAAPPSTPATPAPAPDPAAPTSPPKPTLPADEPFNRDILATTIPFGIALALGSIAFFFMKVKENIYIYMCGIYVRSVWVCLDIYIWIYMYVFYIYFIYIYLFILKKEKRKK